jgi:cytochrome c-type biogenesis protein CcmE
MRKYGKFAALIVIVIGTLVWLATAGMSENKTYYKTINELGQMGDQAFGKRLRVGGDVESGSIQRVGSEVVFVITQEQRKLKVAYHGTDPLPDTFKDGAQALADGKLERDGTFHASRIQAKCASKYEAKPGQAGKMVPETKAAI